MENIYYVYKHFRADDPNGEPFYIGKGKGKRAFIPYKRNAYWKNIVKKHGIKIEITHKNLSEKDAYIVEKCLIRHYKEVRKGCEANFHEGGNSGIADKQKVSKALKKGWEKRRLAGKDRPWNKGISPSKNQKIKYAKSRGCKPFKAINRFTNKVEWQGLLQTDCIQALGLNLSSKGNINSCLKGVRNYHKDWIFKYIN